MTTATDAPRATRSSRGRVLAGVARGLAEHLHLPVWVVRIAFVVLTVAGGIGVVLYAIFWAVLPLARDSDGEDQDVESRGADLTRLLALAALVLGVGLLLAAFGFNIVGGVALPVIVAIIGAALVWQQADADQRAAWSSTATRAARQTAGSTAQAGRWRIVAGIGLVVLGLVGVLVNRTGVVAAV
ncbi:MAG: PspC domain-containing protein, partial [bacterium]|nr:PspC domain-containing protein [bacterium]